MFIYIFIFIGIVLWESYSVGKGCYSFVKNCSIISSLLLGVEASQQAGPKVSTWAGLILLCCKSKLLVCNWEKYEFVNKTHLFIEGRSSNPGFVQDLENLQYFDKNQGTPGIIREPGKSQGILIFDLVWNSSIILLAFTFEDGF